MTEGKTFKRRVRERMSKTGESYTAARANVSDKRDRNDAAKKRLGSDRDRPADTKLKEATGKTFDQWFSVLDRWGATKKKHGDIARYLLEEKDVDGWWAQTIAYWYERSRGMRLKHQKSDGFEISASKTIAAPVGSVFDAFVEDAERKKWLPDASMSVRTSRPDRDARFDWEDGSTRVVVWFQRKGPSKTQVALAHQKLADADDAETMKAMWRESLAELKEQLES